MQLKCAFYVFRFARGKFNMISLILQAQSQLKAIYKDNADTIVGNCDCSIFLGGKEPTTLPSG